MPWEILAMICRELKSIRADRSLAKLARACQALSPVSITHLYTSLVLSTRQIRRRLRGLPSWEHFATTRHLTISSIAKAGVIEGNQFLESRIVRSMSSLVTLSVVFPPYSIEDSVSTIAICGLVHNIPASVRALELDTLGWVRNTGDYHICDAIARVIPQLVRLRLRLHSLCPDMFFGISREPVRAPQLRSLIINGVLDCKRPSSYNNCARHESRKMSICHITATHRSAKRCITSALHQFGAHQDNPELVDIKYIVHEAVTDPEHPHETALPPYQARHPCFSIWNIREGTRTLIPASKWDSTSPLWFARLPREDENEIEDVTMSKDAITDRLEGSAGWAASRSGLRFPRSLIPVPSDIGRLLDGPPNQISINSQQMTQWQGLLFSEDLVGYMLLGVESMSSQPWTDQIENRNLIGHAPPGFEWFRIGDRTPAEHRGDIFRWPWLGRERG